MALLVPWIDIVMVGAILDKPPQQLLGPQDIAQTIVAAVAGGLWFWYLRISIRVRNTFVT